MLAHVPKPNSGLSVLDLGQECPCLRPHEGLGGGRPRPRQQVEARPGLDSAPLCCQQVAEEASLKLFQQILQAKELLSSQAPAFFCKMFPKLLTGAPEINK